jgi:hypothetical protein
VNGSRVVRTPSIALVLAPVLLLAISCGRGHGTGETVVARAYGERLLWSDLRQVIPIDLAAEDSAALAQQYIRNWLRQRAVLHQAELNLNAQDKDFETQLRDYRNSLVIYAYEQALVQQKLDTVVRPQEMAAYHDRNGANFELRDPVVRVRWVKLREGDRRIMKRLENDFLNGNAEAMHDLEMWLAQRGLSFTDRSHLWTPIPALQAELGARRSLDTPLSAPKKVILKEGDVAWFVDLLELRASGETAPLELVTSDIRAIIINQRKIQLLEQMREDLYREALEQNDLEIL